MVETILVASKIENAEELLQELDRQGFPVEAMFWIIPPESRWRLIIGSTLVRDQGPLVGYRRLSEIYRGLDLLGLDEDEISLLDPHGPQFQSLKYQASHSSKVVSGKFWIQFDDAVVYRWNNLFVEADLSCNVTLDELNSIWKEERKRSNQPLLLMELTGKRVRLRFHPQHGDLPDIEGIKISFQIAFLRARPDCNLTWLA